MNHKNLSKKLHKKEEERKKIKIGEADRHLNGQPIMQNKNNINKHYEDNEK